MHSSVCVCEYEYAAFARRSYENRSEEVFIEMNNEQREANWSLLLTTGVWRKSIGSQSTRTQANKCWTVMRAQTARFISLVWSALRVYASWKATWYNSTNSAVPLIITGYKTTLRNLYEQNDVWCWALWFSGAISTAIVLLTINHKSVRVYPNEQEEQVQISMHLNLMGFVRNSRCAHHAHSVYIYAILCWMRLFKTNIPLDAYQ